MKEFGKQCQLCKKQKESHMYPQKINNKWLRICINCWEKQKKMFKYKPIPEIKSAKNTYGKICYIEPVRKLEAKHIKLLECLYQIAPREVIEKTTGKKWKELIE